MKKMDHISCYNGSIASKVMISVQVKDSSTRIATGHKPNIYCLTEMTYSFQNWN